MSGDNVGRVTHTALQRKTEIDMHYSIATVVLATVLASPNLARSAPDLTDKVVLANLDRYQAYLKVGTTPREIKPKKASVLSPKTYPITIEY